MERDVHKCCLKRYFPSEFNGERNVRFYSVVLAGGPNFVSLIIISLLSMKAAFVLGFTRRSIVFR